MKRWKKTVKIKANAKGGNVCEGHLYELHILNQQILLLDLVMILFDKLH